MGGHLRASAIHLGLGPEVLDASEASSGAWLNRIAWRLAGRRQPLMHRFQRKVVHRLSTMEPTTVVAVGRIALGAKAVTTIRSMGHRIVIWLTDDPWNKNFASRWHFDSLRHYSQIFTPRTRNIEQLQKLCGDKVRYLPFAYNEAVHLAKPVVETEVDSDVMFVGGADSDRVPFIESLAEQGLCLRLFGGYWHRNERLRRFAAGIATPQELIRASQRAKVVLILVRRANRDEHVMRSYEAAACGGCLLVEDTQDHRRLFGDSAVEYFSKPADLLGAFGRLQSEDRRNALRFASFQSVVNGKNSYHERLSLILEEQI